MTRRGFTLIELLAAIVILGILVSIVSIRIAAIKDRAIRTSMIEDLKNLVTAEESYYSVNEDYTSKVSMVETSGKKSSSGTIAFSLSPGNTLKLTRKGTGGWNATMTNTRLSTRPKTCGVFMGPATYSPNKNVQTPGVPDCY